MMTTDPLVRATMHANLLLDECDGNKELALELAESQLKNAKPEDLDHWRAVYAHLGGKAGL
jgi:hypothetical protein